MPAGAQVTAADEVARLRVDVTIPAGALPGGRKEGLVTDVTAVALAAAGLGETEAGRVWVLIHEQPDGTWGAGGRVVSYADLVTLARRQLASGAGRDGTDGQVRTDA